MQEYDYLTAFDEEAKKWRPIWEAHFDEGVPTVYEYSKEPLKWWIKKWADETPDKTYLICGDTSLSHKECNEISNRFANALLALGIKKGDRVGTMSINLPQYVLAINAMLKIGVIESPASPLYTVSELTQQFSDSGAETIIVMASFADKAIKIMRDPKSTVKRVIVFQTQDAVVNVEEDPAVYDMDTLCQNAEATEPDVQVYAEDVMRLQYTGGTTGVPKGCVITNYMAHTQAARGAIWDTQNYKVIPQEELRILAAVPINHVYGWNAALNTGYNSGASIVIVPQPNSDELLKAIVKHKPNLFCTVPAMLIGLINHPDVKNGTADISSLKALFCGSAPLANSVKEDFHRLTGGQVMEGYGMSETTNILTGSNMTYSKEGSVGIPLPEMDAIIVDIETGTKVMPCGEIGEIIARGSQNITEYWNKPEETAIAIRGDWLYTGDIGKLDEDGFLYILDRKKDTIIVSGFNVYPREIDELVFAHPKVREACAVGLPHPKKGEYIKLFVALNDGETMTEEEVKLYCRESLAPYKIPSVVEFLPALPRTLVGKVDRKSIREMELEKIKS